MNIKQLLSKLSVENIKMELMHSTSGINQTFMSRLDPRILVYWYLIFAVVPWFFYNNAILLTLFAFVTVVVSFSKASRMIILLLAAGVLTELACYALVAVFIGGGTDAFVKLITLTIKLVIISLASIAVFASMTPQRLADTLLSFGISGRLTFAISYGYRMLPVLIEEYQNIVNTFRLRGKAPDAKGFLYSRYILYMAKIMLSAFYPLIFNTAKRTRTTVEALELKGFTYALEHGHCRKLKLSYMKINGKDISFLLGSVLYIILMPYLGSLLF